jgi:hypothetical protein
LTGRPFSLEAEIGRSQLATRSSNTKDGLKIRDTSGEMGSAERRWTTKGDAGNRKRTKTATATRKQSRPGVRVPEKTAEPSIV